MRLEDEFFDNCTKYKGYEITIYKKDDSTPVMFRLTEDEFEQRKQLVIWLDFLIKTDQWVPYELYKDLFDLEEYMYPGLRVIEDMDIHYLEYTLRTKKINIY
jgi:hypothetical protein